MIAAIDGLEHLAMTTNGTLLADKAPALKEAGLDSINVSLDTLDPERYRALTREGISATRRKASARRLPPGFP